MRYLEHWGQTVHVGSLSIWDKEEIFILRTKYFLTGGTFLLNMYHTFYFHIEALSNVSKCLSDVNEVTPDSLPCMFSSCESLEKSLNLNVILLQVLA